MTREILNSKGLQCPIHLALQADNTCREQRNSWTMLFSSWLVGHGVVRTVDELFYRVGHTHNECDQRFFVLASALARHDTLQTPEDSIGLTYNMKILLGSVLGKIVQVVILISALQQKIIQPSENLQMLGLSRLHPQRPTSFWARDALRDHRLHMGLASLPGTSRCSSQGTHHPEANGKCQPWLSLHEALRLEVLQRE